MPAPAVPEPNPFPEGAPGSARATVEVVRQRVEGNAVAPADRDDLAIEDPLEIEIVHRTSEEGETRRRVVTMRTPGHDADLVHGFLYAEGILRTAADLRSLTFPDPPDAAAPRRVRATLRRGIAPAAESRDQGHALNASCGVCGSPSLEALGLSPSLVLEDPVRLDRTIVHQLPGRMRAEQDTFRRTGGLHAAAIFSATGELLVSREDIGRHNALDKAVGHLLRTGRLPARGCLLCVSGRMSYEILQKALLARIPVVVGVGAPSSLAVALANDFGVTLCGFARGDTYNIYSRPERLRGPLPAPDPATAASPDRGRRP